MDERIRKWRLILGKDAEAESEMKLDGESQGMDNVLEALYEGKKKGGLGKSAPGVNRWLGDIRKYFSTSVVQLMQKDALDRLGLRQMLLEPELLESVTPDINLVGTILSLNKVIPEKTRSTARQVVRKVVEELEKKLKNPMREAVEGSIHRAVRNRRPRFNEIDWNRTIRANLKHYQQELNTIIPEHLIGYGRKGQALKTVILLVDQSGSMASSIVYASVFGAILASLRSVRTHMIVFDTEVVDLSDLLDDPVELLFGTQLGGGTDINRALTYSEGLVRQHSETILLLISDLYEGGSEEALLRRVAGIHASGVQLITLLALTDQGTPSYDHHMAGDFQKLGVPTFACTPDLFPSLMAAAIKRKT